MKRRIYWGLSLGILALAALLVALNLGRAKGQGWSAEERKTLEGLWIGSLEALPPDPTNRYADDPKAAQLGHKLFFDPRFSSNGQVSCASCHKPELAFSDGLPLGKGVGTTTRKTMTIVGTAYSPWQFWDGRKDSQWAQALGPLESPVEHGGNRTQYAHLIARHYKAQYEALFGKLPDLSRLPASAGPVEDRTARANWERMTPAEREAVTRIYVNMGKAIAAYERKILPGASRFDQYAEAIIKGDAHSANTILNVDEVAGLKLFIGKAGCTNCHGGPLFTNNDFHNTGIPVAAGLPEDLGRALGAKQVKADEFNCLSRYSDAKPSQCSELRFLKADDHTLLRAFKPPTLRNVAETGPYMHAGQKKTLREVLEHYNTAPTSPAGHSELKPLRLSEKELWQLEAFLKSLSGPLNAPAGFLAAPK